MFQLIIITRMTIFIIRVSQSMYSFVKACNIKSKKLFVGTPQLVFLNVLTQTATTHSLKIDKKNKTRDKGVKKE